MGKKDAGGDPKSKAEARKQAREQKKADKQLDLDAIREYESKLDKKAPDEGEYTRHFWK